MDKLIYVGLNARKIRWKIGLEVFTLYQPFIYNHGNLKRFFLWQLNHRVEDYEFWSHRFSKSFYPILIWFNYNHKILNLNNNKSKFHEHMEYHETNKICGIITMNIWKYSPKYFFKQRISRKDWDRKFEFLSYCKWTF